MSEFTSYRGRGRGRPPWNAHVHSGQESPRESQESEEERPPAGPPHAMGFYPGHHGFPHPAEMHQMYPPFYPPHPQHLPMMVPNPMATSYPPYVFMYPQGQPPPPNPSAPSANPNPETSETELTSTDHTPPLPATEVEVKEEKPVPPKKKLLVFKDPKTGKELDLSKDVIRSTPPPPKVEEPKIFTHEAPVSPVSPTSPTSPKEEEEEQRPVKKLLKGLKNAPLPPKPSDESKLASKRILNKPLVKTAPAFVPAVPVYTWPLSREAILLLMPKHRPPRELYPEEVIPLGVVYPKKTAPPSSSRGGRSQPSEWRAQQNPRGRNAPAPKKSSVHVAPLASTEKAYKVLQPSQLDEKERLKRQVMSQLNKITLDSCDVITGKISDITITEPWQLDLIVGSVFDKAVIEHHYSEMYADMCIQLRNRWPELPYTFINEETGESNTIAITFARTLIEKCQNEFDAIPASLEPTDEERDRLKNDAADLEILRSKKKERILGNMKFIAQLYLRQLLSTNVISSVVNQLLSEELPEEHYIECVCMFLQNVGGYLENRTKGVSLLDTFFDQLRGLVDSEQYPKRIQFMILNLFDVRSGGWKSSRAMGKLQSAKTKDEVRREQNVKAAPATRAPTFYRQPVPAPKPRYNASNIPAIQSRQVPLVEQRVDEDPSSSSDTASSGTEAPPALQVASFTSDELTADMKALIKKFRIYFHEDRNLESFVDCLEGKDLKSWAPVAHYLLDMGVQDPRKFTGDAELLVALVTVAKRISWIDLSAAYCGFCQDLPDLAVDVPMAPAFLNEVLARFLVANQTATIEHLVAPAWSTIESHDVVKYASGVIEAVKTFYGESQMHAAVSALKPRLSEWLTEAELARVLNVEEEDTRGDEEVDELVRAGEFTSAKLLELVAAKRKNVNFVTRRVELLVRSNKQPWTTVPWEDRLAPAHVYLKALLRPGVAQDEEVEAIRQFCKVMMFIEFKPADCSSVAVAFAKLGIFTCSALKHFIANTLDASAEKLAALDGLNRAVKCLEE